MPHKLVTRETFEAYRKSEFKHLPTTPAIFHRRKRCAANVCNGSPRASIHLPLVPHICVNRVSIGSDNGLSPIRRQAILWTNTRILLVEPFWTKFSEILIEIHIFPFKKMHLKISSATWRPFCPSGDAHREKANPPITKNPAGCWPPAQRLDIRKTNKLLTLVPSVRKMRWTC